MRILLTGVAGFIGSHTAERLLAEDWRVIGLDNFDPFYDRGTKERNLEPFSGHPAFTFTEADIRQRQDVAKVFAQCGPFDAVLHLAAKAGVRPSIKDPIGYEQTNVAGTTHLLAEAIRQKEPPRFVFGSSSSVYGNNKKVPFSEDDRVDHPISPYAATKKSGELICHAYHHLHDMPLFCLRFFTVYGPRQRPDLAIMKFARRILAGKPIQMFGDGTSSRDYTYIEDIVDGICQAIERCRGYEVINLGSEHPVTLREMIDTVAAACGCTPDIERLPMQPGDVGQTFADVTRAKHLLDYAPRMPFEEGVQRQVAWLQGCG